MRITMMRVEGDSGTTYDVTVDANGSARCSCPSFRYRTRWCKHLAWVYDTLGLRVDANA